MNNPKLDEYITKAKYKLKRHILYTLRARRINAKAPYFLFLLKWTDQNTQKYWDARVYAIFLPLYILNIT
jgi:hypothetical protein